MPEIVRDVPAGLELGLRNYWYPVLQSEELPRNAPVGIKCLDESLVLWRDASGAPATLHDRCPHRSARLSVGRVLAGQLQCIFHGLRFDRVGACALIPWEPEDSPLRREVPARAYPTCELGGYIWAYLGDTDRFPPPPLEDEVPPELLREDEFMWFRMPTEIWHANWLLCTDGGDAFHAVTLHAETQAVAEKTWEGGRAQPAGVPLVDRRIQLARGSYGIRAISTDRAGNPIHHGHLLDVKGERFVLPALTTNPIRPVPGVEPYVSRLWMFPVDYGHTMVVRYVAQRATTPEQRERWTKLFQAVVKPRLEGISREDALIAAAQGDLVSARSEEYLFEADVEIYAIRQSLKDAFLAQLNGERVAPTPEALVYPV
jgi:phenylpropionate dioxygenase-like ring-hydroxylating dioxygenase large terminal subunit